ncbi:TPA: DUF3310 domain-containing protein [Streptococcus pyogenes]|nr:gp29 [Streptococcus pyogenes]HEP1865970.1 DUF3310 domain-containing protein [Streptococcus pyogenes]HEP2131658.1 DUF3310 domain-containing protein [Streptococcus pyogenes]HEP2301938.1 DUF3310 domain-containing protein [Streptococcus pyogenes]HEP2310444.1 DUF3310 domain-containing protein [Streptococcus pyogenes]
MNINEVLYLPVKREGLNIGPDKFFCKHRYRTLDGDEVASSFKAKTKEELLDQQKPEIPEFVADWLDKCDREFKNLTYIFGNDCPKEVKEWCAVCGNHQKMLRALLYGYKVVDTEKVWFPVKKYFHDSVNKPSHYQGEYGLEAIAVIDNFMGDLAGKASWAWGNMIKYVLRFQKKNGLEDLKKARKNLDWLIEEMEKNND